MVQALPNAARETIETLAGTARLSAVGPGDVVIRQGETIPFTLVIRGYGAFRRTTTDGRQLVLGIASPGWLVGHPGIAGRSASLALVAITPATVARWSGRDVRALVLADPGLAISVIDTMARFWGMSHERLDGFIHQEARGRVLRVLATYADLFSATGWESLPTTDGLRRAAGWERLRCRRPRCSPRSDGGRRSTATNTQNNTLNPTSHQASSALGSE